MHSLSEMTKSAVEELAEAKIGGHRILILQATLNLVKQYIEEGKQSQVMNHIEILLNENVYWKNEVEKLMNL